MIFVDFSSIAFSAFMPQAEKFMKAPNNYKSLVLNIIRHINVTHRKQYGELIVCFDGKLNWRREVFPEYKQVRRNKRDDSVINWDDVFTLMSEIRNDIKEYTPFKNIQVDRAEADDVIGTLCYKLHNGPNNLIISPDKDFIQLQRLGNVRQWSNIQKKFIKPEQTAVKDLELKIIKGDSGDGVPNILSDDDTFINEDKKQGMVTKRRVEEWLSGPYEKTMTTATYARYKRNKKLIDLSQTPDEIKTEITEKFKEPAKGSINSLMTYFARHKMSNLFASLDDFVPSNI